MRKFSTPQRKIPWGGVNLCKRITATVVAVVMGVCGSGVAAWAAGDRTNIDCPICGEISAIYGIGVVDTGEGKSYEDFYSVAPIAGLTSCAGFWYESDHELCVVAKDGEQICQSCLEDIINDYKASPSAGPSGSTQVTAEVASTYSIIVPQAITLDGSGQSGTYSKTFAVTVKGDIGENQQVTVTATPPTMKCTGCADVAAAFTAGYKTTWNRDEAAANSYAGTAANYTVSSTLTPGEWTGTATFACSLGG